MYKITFRSNASVTPVKSVSLLQVLFSYFDAFKFPSSEVVQFRALVTPCMPTCEPVQCDQEDASGELRSINSFGKRRRRRRSANSPRDDLLLVQSIHITDKFGFNRNKSASASSYSTDDMSSVYLHDETPSGLCINLAGVIISGIVFLAVQLAVIMAWTCVWQRKRLYKNSPYHQDGLSLSVPGLSNVARTDSLCKLYDTGYARRF